MTYEHDFVLAAAQRAAERFATDLTPEEQARARAAMDRGEIYLADRGENIEVRFGDDVSVYVHRLTIGPRPDEPTDN